MWGEEKPRGGKVNASGGHLVFVSEETGRRGLSLGKLSGACGVFRV